MLDLEAAYERYAPMAYRRCRALLRDDAAAMDAMQDTFVQLLRRRERLDERALASLVYRVATNVCLNQLRSRRRHPEDAAEALLLRIASMGDVEAQVGARATLRRLFGGEQTSTQAMAVMHLHDGMTLAEVAAETGLSISGVRKRLRTLRGRLVDLEET